MCWGLILLHDTEKPSHRHAYKEKEHHCTEEENRSSHGCRKHVHNISSASDTLQIVSLNTHRNPLGSSLYGESLTISLRYFKAKQSHMFSLKYCYHLVSKHKLGFESRSFRLILFDSPHYRASLLEPCNFRGRSAI